MRPPKRLKVGPAWYGLLRVKCARLTNKKGRTTSESGYIKVDDPKIVMSKRATPIRELEVLIHELTHAWFYGCNRIDLYNNERLVENMSQLITDTIINTPGLLEYLISVRDSQK